MRETYKMEVCPICSGTGWSGHPDDPAGLCFACCGSGGLSVLDMPAEENFVSPLTDHGIVEALDSIALHVKSFIDYPSPSDADLKSLHHDIKVLKTRVEGRIVK